jgi:hypothetical protein
MPTLPRSRAGRRRFPTFPYLRFWLAEVPRSRRSGGTWGTWGTFLSQFRETPMRGAVRNLRTRRRTLWRLPRTLSPPKLMRTGSSCPYVHPTVLFCPNDGQKPCTSGAILNADALQVYPDAGLMRNASAIRLLRLPAPFALGLISLDLALSVTAVRQAHHPQHPHQTTIRTIPHQLHGRSPLRKSVGLQTDNQPSKGGNEDD